uniref:Uncharacterized protein n=1 Tax=Siphoviridae sp. ct96x5 TaxID=2825367 RepID=A0A8S5PSN2_9CAUD|nr:MAG TPA: hypothetical protein [Siphoviridae sp. ct96x5]
MRDELRQTIRTYWFQSLRAMKPIIKLTAMKVSSLFYRGGTFLYCKN